MRYSASRIPLDWGFGAWTGSALHGHPRFMLNARKLLEPGMKVKRWVLVMILGVTAVGLGFAYILTDIYRVQPLPNAAYTITLQFIERPIRGALFMLIGFGLFVFGLLRLNQSLLA